MCCGTIGYKIRTKDSNGKWNRSEDCWYEEDDAKIELAKKMQVGNNPPVEGNVYESEVGCYAGCK